MKPSVEMQWMRYRCPVVLLKTWILCCITFEINFQEFLNFSIQIGLRWRTEKEVISGKGVQFSFFVTGNILSWLWIIGTCIIWESLSSFCAWWDEMPFTPCPIDKQLLYLFHYIFSKIFWDFFFSTTPRFFPL